MMPMRTLLWALSLLAVVASAAWACSSSSSATACNQNPFSCPAGQTCWVRNGPGDYACMSSGSGQNGDLCQPTQGAATCGDGLVCIEPANSAGIPATCTPFCDNGHPCAAGETCTQATFDGTTFISVCYNPNGPVDDAGDDACLFLCDGGEDAPDTAPPVDAPLDTAPSDGAGDGADGPG